MIGDAADPITLATGVAHESGEIGGQFREDFFAKNGPAIFRAEDHVNNHEGQRLGHFGHYRSGLQPSKYIFGTRTWGFAPGWYSVAPLALGLLAALTLVIGCKSSPKADTTRVAQAVKGAKIPGAHVYPPRPTVRPPSFRVFHTTDNSITLVTADNATDDQVAAILWELHVAARAHGFDELHIPQQAQQVIDKRDPMVWFHVYRGDKCASEKYTTGKLPCGPSYHAAGEYTLGSFSNRDHDDGVLLHGEDKQTELWNPDSAGSS